MKSYFLTRKYFSSLLIAISITLFGSCEAETEAEDSKYPQGIIGTWYYTDGEVYREITTNSSQTMVDNSSEGVGSIAISGQATVSLTYMNVFFFETGLRISLTSRPILEYETLPFYQISIYTTSLDTQFSFSAYEENETTFYHTENLDYSFDQTLFSITINSMDLMTRDNLTGELDSSNAISANGTLQNQLVSIPANIPTQTHAGFALDDYFASQTLTLEDDGRFERITDLLYYGLYYSDTLNGTWETNADQLMIMEEKTNDETFEVYIDTVWLDFALGGNILTLQSEGNFCEDNGYYGSIEECHNDVGKPLGFEPGSLIKLVDVVIFNFSQTAPVATASSPSAIDRQLPSSGLPEE